LIDSIASTPIAIAALVVIQLGFGAFWAWWNDEDD
jgi:hypothetical protein